MTQAKIIREEDQQAFLGKPRSTTPSKIHQKSLSNNGIEGLMYLKTHTYRNRTRLGKSAAPIFFFYSLKSPK
jgi:hypothetical protein